MRRDVRTNTQPLHLRRGFTLAEVLVAIVILLIGVVAALQIFPRGYDAYVNTQSAYAALSLLDKTVADLTEHPENVPDGIYPLDMAANSAIIGAFTFEDIRALDYQISDYTVSSAATFYFNHLYPVSGGNRWPLMQPRSVRVPRRIVGETCVIPSEVTALDTASTATNVAFLPKYLPGFGPAQVSSTATTFTIYDLRYRKVSEEAFDAVRERINAGDDSIPDQFYYHADYPNGKLIFLPEVVDQSIRFTFYAINPTTGDVAFVSPQSVTLPATGSIDFATTTPNPTAPPQYNTITAEVTPSNDDYTLTLQGGWRMISGSEQLNRAYRPANIDPGDLEGLAALESGEFAFPMPATLPSGYQTMNMLLGAIYFSKEDAGRTVKIDYTAADWNILHEDITVDDEGYLRLAVPDPKIRDIPNFPREPVAWGLYAPMKVNNSVVMGLVDLHTGVQYHVRVDNPQKRSPLYNIDIDYLNNAQKAQVPDLVTEISMKEAQRGLVRIGRDDGGSQDWQALRGKTYRVYYRARQDWTLQVFRAPAMFWQMSASPENPPSQLGWNMFFADGRNIYVPSVYEGQSVAVDYQYRAETENMESPLLQASGEQHLIPLRMTDQFAAVSRFRLRHQPEPGTPIRVRGVSVTVRALWAQPRSGDASVMDAGPTLSVRRLNERWQGKSVTVILPVTKE